MRTSIACARLRAIDGIRVLDLGSGRNPVNPDWIARVSAALDEAEAAPLPRALVTTCSGDFFSVGFDLKWMAANPDGVPELVASMHELVARMLELPLPTVAALRGHAFAGGLLFALAHDYRVMADGDVYLGLPEIDGRVVFSPGLTDLVRARLAPQTAHEAMTSGRRYAPAEALDERIVDALAPAGEILARAESMAAALGAKHPATYGGIKSQIYRRVLAGLRDREANHADVGKFEPAFEVVGISRP